MHVSLVLSCNGERSGTRNAIASASAIHGFDLGKEFETGTPRLAERRRARALQPPERCIDQISCGRAINLHRSGFDVAYEIVHVARIARYNGGRKAVLAVVCLIDGVGIVRHLDDCDYRPKNFLACDPHVLRDIRENGGGYKIPAVMLWTTNARAPTQQRCLTFADLDVAQHRFQLPRGSERPDIHAGGHPAADLEGLYFCYELARKLRVHLFHHQHAAGTGARLTTQGQSAFDS